MVESFIEKLEKAKKYSDDLNKFTSEHWNCPKEIKQEAKRAKEKYEELQKKEQLMLSKEALSDLEKLIVKYNKLFLANVYDQMESLNKYIKQEECPHENTKTDDVWDSHNDYERIECKDCGKTLSFK